MSETIIGHVDMDAFFAAVEERDTPAFRGQPLAVGADLPAGQAGPQNGRRRGVVSTANYAARAYGLRSGMSINRAWRLSEEARKRGEAPVIFVGGNWRRYSEVSRQVMGIVTSMSPHVLQAGVDETYFDLTHLSSYDAARRVAEEVRAKILAVTGLTASVGVAPNKFLAKMASDAEKPNGLVVVYPELVEGWLAPRSVRAIPGVGPKGEVSLARHGLTTIADLQHQSLEWLEETFGRFGVSLYCRSRGQGSTSLDPGGPAKSISEQSTFWHDTLDPKEIIPQCLTICEHIWRQMGEDGFAGWRCVTITVRFASFITRTRSHTLPAAHTDCTQLKTEALRLLLPFFDQRENPAHEPLRLIGVRVEKLTRR